MYLSCDVTGYPKAFGVDYWTSGTNQGCLDSYQWCTSNRSFVPGESIWKSGHPVTADSCVHINMSNQTANNSVLATETCATEKQFICEVWRANLCCSFTTFDLWIKVRKTGTRGKQLQMECMEIWNVSLAEIDNIDSNAFDPSMVAKNLKVWYEFKKGRLNLYIQISVSWNVLESAWN